MKANESLDALLLTLYRHYSTDMETRQFGILPWSLTEDSGLPLEDAGDSLVLCQRLIDRGWARVVSARKTRRSLQPWASITITEEGIDRAEQLLRPLRFKSLKSIYTATIEGIVRGLKG